MSALLHSQRQLPEHSDRSSSWMNDCHEHEACAEGKSRDVLKCGNILKIAPSRWRRLVYHSIISVPAKRTIRLARRLTSGTQSMTNTSTESKRSDVELIRCVARGDHNAFLDLYDRHASRTLGIIRRVLFDPHDAEDVLQLVMLEIWTRHAGRYDPALGRVDTWMYRLARSRAIDRARANARRGAAEQNPRMVSRSEGARDQSLDVHEDMHQAMAVLDQEHLAPIVLAFTHGMTREQIANHLDVPIGTVKTRIRTGVARLRERLREAEVHVA